MTPEELIENFSYLTDWEDKYKYLIELGEQMPAFPESEKKEENKVLGCQSQVWMIYKKEGRSTLHRLSEGKPIVGSPQRTEQEAHMGEAQRRSDEDPLRLIHRTVQQYRHGGLR